MRYCDTHIGKRLHARTLVLSPSISRFWTLGLALELCAVRAYLLFRHDSLKKTHTRRKTHNEAHLTFKIFLQS